MDWWTDQTGMRQSRCRLVCYPAAQPMHWPVPLHTVSSKTLYSVVLFAISWYSNNHGRIKRMWHVSRPGNVICRVCVAADFSCFIILLCLWFFFTYSSSTCFYWLRRCLIKAVTALVIELLLIACYLCWLTASMVNSLSWLALLTKQSHVASVCKISLRMQIMSSVNWKFTTRLVRYNYTTE